tara:strand:- start:161 stop:385 length:225 start_codon:yes stop_codon:yes gene_type:complete
MKYLKRFNESLNESNRFEEGDKVKLDYDTGVVKFTSSGGQKAIIKWDSDGEEEEWNLETFLLGDGEIIKNNKLK